MLGVFPNTQTTGRKYAKHAMFSHTAETQAIMLTHMP